ncbi:DoxX family protein [Maritimibacter sp. DP1N21-5]|uniref:DoxX family protein n=1 Tax=Maritimibacter sp. DP1N21-5 TaxID=2836867 RepID=UPI001C49373C|nr:DoxX family protein [Maritimibacter sp. DP1N21-5]MBV7408631.1 DoxX family protein [Maritimibacter sp. DP1N21-5]
MSNALTYTAPLARLLLSFMFILSGFQKITGYAGTQGYMEMMGVPGALLPLVILVEVVGGLALLVGFQARIAALLLAGFAIVSGVLFHLVPSFAMEDAMAAQAQMISFMKNLTIAGGMLMVVAFGPGAWSMSSKNAGSVPAE